MDDDKCARQVGYVLLQKQEEGKRPGGLILFMHVSKAEKTFDSTQQECLAAAYAVLILRPYLEGTNFIIRAYHYAFRWIVSVADAPGRLAR